MAKKKKNISSFLSRIIKKYWKLREEKAKEWLYLMEYVRTWQ